MEGIPGGSLAISYFLRQHDLVQVQWVKSQLRISPGAPQRDDVELKPLTAPVQPSVQDEAFKRYPELPLEFDGPMVLVGGGTTDMDLLKSLAARGDIVAADGGADVCAEAGLVPAAVIGDMDSVVDPDRWRREARFIMLDEQLTTDFEKCLYCTKAPVTVALGMTGRRFDHTLAALDSAGRYAEERRIVLVDETDIALVVSGSFSFTVAPGGRVSIHPLARIAFERSEGLEYPLDGLTLAPGVRTGTSNTAPTGAFSVVPAPGERAPWLLVIERTYLDALVDALCRSV